MRQQIAVQPSSAPARPRRRKGDIRSVESELVARYKDGDRAAGAALLKIHAGLIVQWAKRYAGSGVDFEDLLQEAKIGFLDGAARFDAGRDVRLTTYAHFWVRHQVRRYIDDHHSTVRVPARLSRVREGYRYFAWLTRSMASLDAVVSEDDARPLVETVAGDGDDPEQALCAAGERAMLDRILATAGLTAREVDILRQRVVDDAVNLAEIGASFGITGERVRQIETAALEKLRRAARRMRAER